HLGLVNYAKNEGDSEADAIAFADANIDAFAAVPWSGYTDWKKVLFRNGSNQNYEVTAQGGGDKTTFYTSLAYANQQGVTLSSGYERFTARANLTHKANRVTFGINAMFTKSEQKSNSEGTSFSNPLMVYTMTASPSTYPYEQDGSYSYSFPALNNSTNPLQNVLANYDRSTINRFLGSVNADWNIWDNLHVKETLSYDYNNTSSRVWWDPRFGDGRSASGVMQRIMNNRNKLNTQTLLTYNKMFDQSHTVDVLLGFETEDYKTEYVYASGENYPTWELPEIANAGTTSAESLVQDYRMVSFLGRLNYDYRNKYYFSASYRKDGSSRLSRDSRWGDFWSVSGSWRLSNESFMESLKDVITDAKIRASYGINGTPPGDYYGYMGVFEYGAKYNNMSGSNEVQVDNPNLRWEKNYATNIGIDITLWDILSVTAEWYNRDTRDLLMNRPISAVQGILDSGGAAGMLVNVGSMRNRGVEFEIKSTNINRRDLFWTTSLNIGHNKNTLTKLDGDQDEIIDGQLIHRIGYAYNSFYAYEYAGVDTQTGKELYYINKGDNPRGTTANPAQAEKVVIGKPEPTVSGGFTSELRWKGIDFNFTLTYSLGGHAYDNAGWVQSNGGDYHYLGNIPAFYKIEDTWQNPGDQAKLPQFAYGNVNTRSSRWMLSTDHLRVKNVTLGYSLPSAFIRKAGLTKVRAYAAANNLLTWKSKDLYIDPEVRANGVALFTIPPLRTVTFGIEIGF
ncbi:MAG: SusC/RagA family TonB-linked outer membrane protein, partial [Mediterranea sp.]|nr:SusC/RagA family TonB-linked outer membrane protein [Mediterranea sp.]